METWPAWIGLVTMIVASAFFSGAETGFYVVDRFRLEVLAAQRRRRALRVARLLEDQDVLLVTCLVGTNLANQLVTIFFQEIVPAGAPVELLAGLVLTPLLFFFGEVFPKDLYRAHAETLAYRSAMPVHWFRIAFFPATFVLMRLGKWMSSLVGVRDPKHLRYRGREGFLDLLQEGQESGVLSTQQAALGRNVMALHERTIANVMIPRARATCLRPGDTVATLLETARTTPHSRFPFVDEARPIGYVMLRDVLHEPEDRDLRTYLRKPLELGPELTVSAALDVLRRGKVPFAMVVSDRRRFLGVLTAKDLVEEIVGELADL
ncbi:MAG: DUF21 domain-containing protein [Planctomycetes bacterium]|nr:DUF21 domain-containing protein [Planctomycetota bacterium]